VIAPKSTQASPAVTAPSHAGKPVIAMAVKTASFGKNFKKSARFLAQWLYCGDSVPIFIGGPNQVKETYCGTRHSLANEICLGLR
jgi:hypothetical protein